MSKRLTEEDRFLLRHALKGRIPARVLDVGCGYGRIMELIKEEMPLIDVVGLDIADICYRERRGYLMSC